MAGAGLVAGRGKGMVHWQGVARQDWWQGAAGLVAGRGRAGGGARQGWWQGAAGAGARVWQGWWRGEAGLVAGRGRGRGKGRGIQPLIAKRGTPCCGAKRCSHALCRLALMTTLETRFTQRPMHAATRKSGQLAATTANEFASTMRGSSVTADMPRRHTTVGGAISLSPCKTWNS
eukprot:355650-Chlamydomonas_euryale.AAC.1